MVGSNFNLPGVRPPANPMQNLLKSSAGLQAPTASQFAAPRDTQPKVDSFQLASAQAATPSTQPKAPAAPAFIPASTVLNSNKAVDVPPAPTSRFAAGQLATESAIDNDPNSGSEGGHEGGKQR
jgi:hypothetical protein